MDEPTSSLDTRAAAVVMRAAKNVVETGRTIVCTIHQLSIDIFEAFDEINFKIFLLSFPNATSHCYFRQWPSRGAKTTNDVPFPLNPLVMTAMDLPWPAIEAILCDLKPRFFLFDFAHWDIERAYCDYIASKFEKPVLLSGLVVPEPPSITLEEQWEMLLASFKVKILVFCAFGIVIGFLEEAEARPCLLGTNVLYKNRSVGERNQYPNTSLCLKLWLSFSRFENWEDNVQEAKGKPKFHREIGIGYARQYSNSYIGHSCRGDVARPPPSRDLRPLPP
ncbi:hypothetical protein Pint_21703 [Pistacia integerrima]|uniref:Uncharacterized protein n=1 Tax=Pistacia integerrima TaxID=434235 RepID=A0ACC0X9U5_9ROSI|nr:hypothetical protein Pint_21703 [Pistacia integerrima]